MSAIVHPAHSTPPPYFMAGNRRVELVSTDDTAAFRLPNDFSPGDSAAMKALVAYVRSGADGNQVLMPKLQSS